MNDHMPSGLREWQSRGRFARISGIDVFLVDTPGPREGAPAAVILHGFPSSSYDFHLCLPKLAEARRVISFDFPGYGLSEKPDTYSYSLMEQADIVEQLLRSLGISSADVFAHDMGTSVACELVARRERGLLSFAVSSLVLMNGSMLLDLAKLTPSQKLLRSPLGPLFARLSSKVTFKAQLRRILGRAVPEGELDVMWSQLEHRDGLRRLPQIISYIDERKRFRHRWIGALSRLDLPVLVLWGTFDPVAVLAVGETVAKETPGARLEKLEGIGHYPQLEDPARVAEAVLRHWTSSAAVKS